MPQKPPIIPIVREERVLPFPWPNRHSDAATGGPVLDARGRPFRDLRISVTDHCNFRCRYCMPKEAYPAHRKFLAHTELLTFEEIERICRAVLALGVEKLRLTGGEPLLRKNLPALIAKLSDLRTRSGTAPDIAVTTNAALLARQAQALADAGLKRITVSLDALNDALFQSINDVGFPVSGVLKGIEAAQRAGIASIKVNAVIKRGVNDSEVVPLIEHFRGTGVIVRFIEYMDAGTANGWRMDEVVPSAELVERIGRVLPIEPLSANYLGETATRWRLADGSGEIGFISSITAPFCRECSRMRLSVEGKLYPCLFADAGWDIRTMLRGGATADELREFFAAAWQKRSDHYSEIRSEATRRASRIEMSFIGG